MMAIVQRTCIVCGKQMQTHRTTKTTCSPSCRQKLYKQRLKQADDVPNSEINIST